MATRSLVCTNVPYVDVTIPGVLECERAGYRYVYVHWDGYPEYRYPLLRHCYNSTELVEKLIALGDMSGLNETIESCSPYNEPDSAFRVCHTDKELLDAAHGSDAEYVYVWDGSRWNVYKPEDHLKDLTPVHEFAWNTGGYSEVIERLGGKK